jgi:hypothetical protein
MTLFDRILLWRYGAGALTRREVGVLRITMRSYAQAFKVGDELPELPRYLRRQLRTLWIWSAHRLFLEQPTHFVWGLILAIPALVVIGYKLVIGSVHLIEMALTRI